MGPWVSGWSSVGRWLMGRWSLDLIKPKNKNRSKYTYIYIYNIYIYIYIYIEIYRNIYICNNNIYM